ncbi:MAG: DUF2510 domain-containing protein [Propionibacteriales bacterium]|nr:DUF2510 domain-containing protein [Propionibacteriales bacterium]
MSTSSGWYPDPGGQRGAFRYWDGQRWSEQLSASPTAPPPRPGQPLAGPRRGGNKGVWWLVGAGVVLLGLVLVSVFAIRSMRTVGANPNPGGVQVSQNPCPPEPTTFPSVSSQKSDGRVYGGRLSYPQLSAPFGPVDGDLRVPFGRDVAKQEAPVEMNYQPGQSWVASVLVGELSAGDGFYNPETGAEIVAKCAVGVFYGDAKVTRDDRVSKATTVDGYDAWLLETQLSFDIPGLKTKGELMILMIVEIDSMRGALFYASIPDSTPELVQPARDAMAGLKVTK